MNNHPEQLKIPQYCRECGLPLQMSVDRADKIEIDYYCFGGDIIRSKLGSAFDKFTGAENFAEIYTCPNWKRYWVFGSNSHDKIINYNNELHYE